MTEPGCARSPRAILTARPQHPTNMEKDTDTKALQRRIYELELALDDAEKHRRLAEKKVEILTKMLLDAGLIPDNT